jgi:hypothetical protein
MTAIEASVEILLAELKPGFMFNVSTLFGDGAFRYLLPTFNNSTLTLMDQYVKVSLEPNMKTLL